MLNLTKPRYVMPVPRRLQAPPSARPRSPRPSASTPRRSSCGENGDVLELDARGARFGKPEGAGMIFVDGVDIGDPADAALRDRRMLSADGIFIVVATISEQDGGSVADPEVIFRGVAFMDEAGQLVDEIKDTVEDSLERAGRRRACATSSTSSRSCTTTSGRSSMTGCGGGRWSCRSWSRSDDLDNNPQGLPGRVVGLPGAHSRLGRFAAGLWPACRFAGLVGGAERAGAGGAAVLAGVRRPWGLGCFRRLGYGRRARRCRRLRGVLAGVGSAMTGGRCTVNRAPPWGEASASTVPPWVWVTAATIARPRPKEPPRSPEPRAKRANSLGRISAAMPGPSSATTSSAEPSGSARVLAVMCVPGGVWRRAFSSRLVATRTAGRRGCRSPASGVMSSSTTCSRLTDSSSLAASISDVGEVERLDADGSCPASVAGEQQQVGDQAPHPLRRAQRRLGRLAVGALQRVDQQLEVGEHAGQRRAQLVRGVGDERALALERRLGLVAGVARATPACRSACATAQRPRHRRRVGAACGSGSRVRSISLAAAVSPAIGAIARRATSDPAANARMVPISAPRKRSS